MYLKQLQQLRAVTNVNKPSAKCALTPLGLTVAASATDAAIHKKAFGSDIATLTISNEEINDFV